jgi:hypothetical protein
VPCAFGVTTLILYAGVGQKSLVPLFILSRVSGPLGNWREDSLWNDSKALLERKPVNGYPWLARRPVLNECLNKL